MKKIIISLLLLVSLSVFYSCDNSNEMAGSENDDKISIIAVNFPAYDFAREIAGSKADIKMLLSPGMEVHSFEPTPADIISIQNCDVFIYGGGESDSWAKGILDSIDMSEMQTISMMDCVQVLQEEIVKGMADDEHQSDSHEQENKHEGEEQGYDEHVWTDPMNALIICDEIHQTLCEIDINNADYYNEKYIEYAEKLTALDNKFKSIVESASRNEIVFGDRFPFRYFTEAYGLEYYAAFPGCSSETEPSIATLTYLIDKVNDENIPVIFKIELSNGKTADSIAESTFAKVLQFHSCHNLTVDDFNKGETYLTLMEQNAVNLEEALN